jgi:hypothetical protein
VVAAALAVDVGDHVAVAAEQRLGRAHLGAQGELALGEAVAAALLGLGLAVILLRAPPQKVHFSILPRLPTLPACGYCGAPNGQA